MSTSTETSLLLRPESLVTHNSTMCIISEDIFANHKNKSEKWIAKNFPAFHSFVFNSITDELPWREKLFLYHNLIDSPKVCECGKKTKFIDIVKGYREFCSKSCQANNQEVKLKRKKSNLQKFGHEFVFQSDEVKNKIAATNSKKYGVRNISSLDSIKEKVRLTNSIRYGVNYPSQMPDTKIKLSSKIKANSDLVFVSKLESLKLTLTNKVAKHELKFIEIISTSRYLLECNSQHQFEIHKTMLNDRIRNNNTICTICNPINSFSDGQRKLFEYISGIYHGKIENNYRGKLGFELDIYLPEISLAFEYNGLYWHSSVYKNKKYHSSKFDKCRSLGIDLVFIWEDSWLNDTNCIKNSIKNLLSGSSLQIPATSPSDTLLVNIMLRTNYSMVSRTEPCSEFVIKGRRHDLFFTYGNLNYYRPLTIRCVWNIGIFELSRKS